MLTRCSRPELFHSGNDELNSDSNDNQSHHTVENIESGYSHSLSDRRGKVETDPRDEHHGTDHDAYLWQLRPHRATVGEEDNGAHRPGASEQWKS